MSERTAFQVLRRECLAWQAAAEDRLAWPRGRFDLPGHVWAPCDKSSVQSKPQRDADRYAHCHGDAPVQKRSHDLHWNGACEKTGL